MTTPEDHEEDFSFEQEDDNYLENEGPCLITLTFGTMDEAQALARKIVTQQLAACVQLVPGATSIYHWEGELKETSEILAFVKTTQGILPELLALIEEEHSYDTPEFLIYEIVAGSPSYMEWLFSNVRSPIEE
jgi:periplasmic divalent cation tolerance protein